MQLDHVRITRARVQPIDVLRDKPFEQAQALKPDNREMRGIRRGTRDQWPANHAACPITLPRKLRAHEIFQRNRRSAGTLPFSIPVTRYSGFRTNSSTRQNEQPRMPFDEIVKWI